MSYLAKECCMSKGVGVSKKGLPSFDRALLEAGVGNYNLVRLSSILPAEHVWVHPKDIAKHIPEGSLYLPLTRLFQVMLSERLSSLLLV
jgi:pyruvoyl-dependent arginine decarboxylase (PvlArgDC)